MKNTNQIQKNIDDAEIFVYVLPEAIQKGTRVSTLSHYLAVHDDMYCTNVYQPFAMRKPSKDGYKGEKPPACSPATFQNSVIQSFMRDAKSVFDLKIFEVRIYDEVDPHVPEKQSNVTKMQDNEKEAENSGHEDEENQDIPSDVFYMTHRLELGHNSCYKKLNEIQNLIGINDEDKYNE
jgi:hypothetical protein